MVKLLLSTQIQSGTQCCRKAVTLHKPDILSYIMTPCNTINIPETSVGCGHRHTKTANLEDTISNNLIPRGKHEELLPGTALNAGSGKQCPTSPSHSAKHK